MLISSDGRVVASGGRIGYPFVGNALSDNFWSLNLIDFAGGNVSNRFFQRLLFRSMAFVYYVNVTGRGTTVNTSARLSTKTDRFQLE